MNWFTKKVECIHCKEVKTKRKFEDKPTCPECRMNILCNREPKRICPVDGSTLVKAYNDQEIIVDKCKKCNGIWLDAGELDAIREVDSNNDDSLTTGVVLGALLNN